MQYNRGCPSGETVLNCTAWILARALQKLWEAQWPIGYGVGLRIKRSSVRSRPWPLRGVLGQGSLLPLSQGETFTLASVSYLAILVKYTCILAKKKKSNKRFTHSSHKVVNFVWWSGQPPETSSSEIHKRWAMCCFWTVRGVATYRKSRKQTTHKKKPGAVASRNRH